TGKGGMKQDGGSNRPLYWCKPGSKRSVGRLESPTMPIRFRCRHCTRLLGIARRKAGTAIRCPQCGELVTVPVADEPEESGLAELDELFPPAPRENGTPHPVIVPVPDPAEPVTAVKSHRPLPSGAPAPVSPSPHKKRRTPG